MQIKLTALCSIIRRVMQSTSCTVKSVPKNVFAGWAMVGDQNVVKFFAVFSATIPSKGHGKKERKKGGINVNWPYKYKGYKFERYILRSVTNVIYSVSQKNIPLLIFWITSCNTGAIQYEFVVANTQTTTSAFHKLVWQQHYDEASKTRKSFSSSFTAMLHAKNYLNRPMYQGAIQKISGMFFWGMV